MRTPAWHRRALQLLGVVVFTTVAQTAVAAPGYALYGKPKYEDGYAHFDYAEPQAPKGGTLTLSQVAQNSNFDKFNPYSLRGRAAPGLQELVFETLAEYGYEEVTTQYGVLARDIEVAPDLRSATFHLYPQARFSNGDPVTAADVKYSFDTLTGERASPTFQSYFAEIESATVTGPLSVRFDFRRRGRDLPFIAGALPVFSPKWGLRPDGTRVPFDQLRREPPVASGPYRVDRILDGKSVSYQRNPDWWGAQTPARRGFFNFDRVVYKLYKEYDLQVEAFRAGDFDVISEYRARSWCCRYNGKRFASGELVQSVFPHANPPGMNGTVFNTRRPPYDDIRVRRALNLIYDFEWNNNRIFHGKYGRVNSYFMSTELAARGLPSADELALLEPWRDQLDPAVFGPPPEQPSTAPPSSFRANLEQALALLGQAGWHYRDGKLRNAAGERFEVEVLSAQERLPAPHVEGDIRNMLKAGVDVIRRPRDAVAARKKLDAFDFGMTSQSLRESRLPGTELLRAFHSRYADERGSENLVGLKSPVVDALLHQLLEAETERELIVAARALDRVLLHGHYFISSRYNFEHWIGHHSRLRRPGHLPLYYDPTTWILRTWWDGRPVDPTGVVVVAGAIPADRGQP